MGITPSKELAAGKQMFVQLGDFRSWQEQEGLFDKTLKHNMLGSVILFRLKAKNFIT